ncbi:hypothetical protein NM208_g14915 [Fusarium decemcellulare]|uniref:Uncharacterized protein n=1 Tax=Fusarium decemcellulare TaxID=57161 RepID=A0ACC1RIQ9_9HYPO|nr:hypothetical protein NM208_g14915 [Fusarium decemcellulare]
MVSKLAIWSLFLIEASVGAPKLPVELHARQDDPFCRGNGGTWNADTWNNNGMTDFVFNRCNYYSGVGGGSWPPVEGVPRAFAEYGSNGKDSVWNWPTDCRRYAAK